MISIKFLVIEIIQLVNIVYLTDQFIMDNGLMEKDTEEENYKNKMGLFMKANGNLISSMEKVD